MRDTYKHLLTLAETLSSGINLAEATISNRAVGRATLFHRLRAQKGCTVDTAIQAFDWFADNWPDDLEWPDSVPRPSGRGKEAA